MEINWLLVIIVCAWIWLAGYCFGYVVGKSAGLKEGTFGVLNKMTEFVEKLPKRKEYTIEREQNKKSD